MLSEPFHDLAIALRLVRVESMIVVRVHDELVGLSRLLQFLRERENDRRRGAPVTVPCIISSGELICSGQYIADRSRSTSSVRLAYPGINTLQFCDTIKGRRLPSSNKSTNGAITAAALAFMPCFNATNVLMPPRECPSMNTLFMIDISESLRHRNKVLNVVDVGPADLLDAVAAIHPPILRCQNDEPLSGQPMLATPRPEPAELAVATSVENDERERLGADVFGTPHEAGDPQTITQDTRCAYT